MDQVIAIAECQFSKYRAKAAEKINADVSQVRLITAGKELPVDSETLQAHHIGDGHTVHAILRPKDYSGSATNQRQVSSSSSLFFFIIFFFFFCSYRGCRQYHKTNVPFRVPYCHSNSILTSCFSF